MTEPILEPIVRKMRFGIAHKYLTNNSVVVDIGCGPKAPFLNLIKNKIKQGIGIDPLVNIKTSQNLEIIKSSLEKEIPLKNNYADFVTLFAVLEHLENPEKILCECYRVLKPNGKLLLTTPTPMNKYLCEFLAYRLHLLSEREIREHKRYLWKKELTTGLKNAGFKKISHKYFEIYLNNFVIAQKVL